MIRRILHVSDLHVSADGFDGFGVDALDALDRVLASAAGIPGLDLVVVSGDVADDGSAAGLSAVRDRVAGFAHALGLPQVYCMGNHDDRSSFRQVLGSGHLNPAGADVGSVWNGESGVAAVSLHDGLRIVTLDSVVTGEVHGHVDRDQLRWLSDALASPAPAGSLVVLHHPPFVPEGSDFFRRAALDNPADLAQAVQGTDVRAILCGHFHAPGFSVLGRVPVSIAPAVIWRIDVTAPAHLVRGTDSRGVGLADLGDTEVCFQVADCAGTGRQLFEVDARTGEPSTAAEASAS